MDRVDGIVHSNSNNNNMRVCEYVYDNASMPVFQYESVRIELRVSRYMFSLITLSVYVPVCMNACMLLPSNVCYT